MRNVNMDAGFDGRMFLTKEEWETYKRRRPVRYIRRKHTECCYVCMGPPTPDNPLQHAHLIGFAMGVLELGLTPDFLDSADNLVSAHRKECNAVAELSLTAARERIHALGGIFPAYLSVP